jgi:hypothetical protein
MVTLAQSDLQKHLISFCTVVTFCVTKVNVIWHVALCSLVETDQSFKSAYCFHHETAMRNQNFTFCVTFKFTFHDV